MLWNWYTVDACFLSSSWHITSPGMFAGSCIGVICLVVSLEFLRRLGKEYDQYILHNFQTRHSVIISTSPYTTGGGPGGLADTDAADASHSNGSDRSKLVGAKTASIGNGGSFRPNLRQQVVRALLHMLQFAVAYFIMLLAMYYNGYIIICIFIGAFIGSFIFSWQTVSVA